MGCVVTPNSRAPLARCTCWTPCDAIDPALPSLSAQSTAADKAIADTASEIQHLKAVIKWHTSQPTSRSSRSPSPPMPYFCSISPPLTPPDQQAPLRKEGCLEGAESRLKAETDAESSPSAWQQWQHCDEATHNHHHASDKQPSQSRHDQMKLFVSLSCPPCPPAPGVYPPSSPVLAPPCTPSYTPQFRVSLNPLRAPVSIVLLLFR
jgi:hypothetical protein